MPNKRNGRGGRRGFAAMDDRKQRDISSRGGKASHSSRGNQGNGRRSRR